MHHFTLCRRRRLDRATQKGQVLIEGLFVMMGLAAILLVLMTFIKNQNGVLETYELPAKIKHQSR